MGVFFQALSAVSKLLVQVPSPFYQLKHVKVPQGHKDSSISADLKRYLLGRSPEATIVTKLPQVVKQPFNCTMKLNMLCTIVKDYTRMSMTEVDIEMIAEYRAQFADLQRSFNVKWLVNHLNYVEQFQITRLVPDKLDAVDSCIADGSHDSGYIGDDLFPGP